MFNAHEKFKLNHNNTTQCHAEIFIQEQHKVFRCICVKARATICTVLLNIATELEENKICNYQNTSSHHGLLALIFFSLNYKTRKAKLGKP